MKMRGAKAVHYDSGPNMTPLVDVVMVILIFLMLAGSFAGASRYIISKGGIHAKGVGAAKADPNKPIETPIDLDVFRGKMGGFVAQGTGINPTNDPDVLKNALEGKLAEFTRNGMSTENLQVVLHPTKSVLYQDLIRVYQSAINAKFTKVAFAQSK